MHHEAECAENRARIGPVEHKVNNLFGQAQKIVIFAVKITLSAL
jgi:hypothetical protein